MSGGGGREPPSVRIAAALRIRAGRRVVCARECRPEFRSLSALADADPDTIHLPGAGGAALRTPRLGRGRRAAPRVEHRCAANHVRGGRLPVLPVLPAVWTRRM